MMPSFKWLFHEIRVPARKTEDGALALDATPALARIFTMNADVPIRLFPNESGLTFVAPRKDGELPIDGTPVLDFTPFQGNVPDIRAVDLVVPTTEMVGLVRYVQKLGASRGAWREVFPPQNVALSVMAIPQNEDFLTRGKAVYERRCIGCQSRRDVSVPAPTRLHGGGVQVPDDAVGLAADRRRSLPDAHARCALDRHADVA
jgi:cytochrome c oxidase cbb3-type subunit 2